MYCCYAFSQVVHGQRVVIGQRVCLQTCWLTTKYYNFREKLNALLQSNLARSFGYKHVAPSLTLNGKFSWGIFSFIPQVTGGSGWCSKQYYSNCSHITRFDNDMNYCSWCHWLPMAHQLRWYLSYQRSDVQSKHGRWSCILLLLGIISNHSFKERCNFGRTYVSTWLTTYQGKKTLHPYSR